MILLLPLIILAAANPCPYCKWDACAFTLGSLPNCTACYDIAALIPIKVPATSVNPQLSPLGVCQLCPEHCGACSYAFVHPVIGPPVPVINCTYCYSGYTTNHYTGKCDPCPSHCDSCHFQVLAPSHSVPYPVINCTSCHARYTNNPFSGLCKPCPDNCASCQCLFKGCPIVSCTQCDSGYISNSTSSGGYECIPAGERRLFEEENQAIPNQGFN